MPTQAESIAEKIAAEVEWTPQAAAVHDAILKAITEKVTAIMERNPDAVLKAIAVIVPTGGGREAFILIDPATQDIADELRRYAEQGEESPLATLAVARIRL